MAIYAECYMYIMHVGETAGVGGERGPTGVPAVVEDNPQSLESNRQFPGTSR